MTRSRTLKANEKEVWASERRGPVRDPSAVIAAPARVWRLVAAAERLAVEGLMLVAIAILPLMALAITYEVIVRRIFNSPTIWVVDASAFALLWVTFLAAPWLIRHESNIRIDIVTERLGWRPRAALAAITSLAGAAVMAVLFWQATSETIQTYTRNTQTIGSWEIPRVLVVVVMPIGSFFASLEFLRVASSHITTLRGTSPNRREPEQHVTTNSTSGA